ncbi:10106_t:CDS:2 [Entrophospora sp. SA101]|nr:1284_t:CDS:2 [Entrophospora sp. SA101]CAJ0633457.1 7925_t:CDS:2 [Entrophospora sp. SA101]CAJ0747572.1 10106_t:CDS:2 [Entrophospora sp. SA101]CAJ0826744.1 17290_t:CDS:2 [Entrophospora sp. SA101]CAJ0905733.1 14400_t:CDS:2 [Entrophospora sp. SA101]
MSDNNIANDIIVDSGNNDDSKKEVEKKEKVKEKEEKEEVKVKDEEDIKKETITIPTNNNINDTDNKEQVLTQTLEVNDKHDKQNSQPTIINKVNDGKESQQNEPPNPATSPLLSTSPNSGEPKKFDFMKKVTSKLDKFINSNASNDSKSQNSSITTTNTTNNNITEEIMIENNQVNEAKDDEMVECSQTKSPVTSTNNETNAQNPRQFFNFASKWSNVRGFFKRSSTTVVNKSRDELDESDKHEEEPGTIDGQNADKKIDEISKRDQLLEGSNINDNKSTNRSVKQTQSTHQALAETANALNERAEKLDQLNDKIENLAGNSNDFLRMAKELSEQQQAKNKKWFPW